MTRHPSRLQLGGFAYILIVLSLSWLAWVDPYTYAYWVRFFLLLPSSILLLCFDYFLAIVLFGPNPTTWVATLYFFVVAIVGAAMQLALAWVVRNQAR